MYSTPTPCLSTASDTMSPRDLNAILAAARTLQRAAQAGAVQPLLRGKNLGLLCESQEAEDAALFRRAATELGARVSHIRPTLSDSSTPQEVQHTARMLGRLYDAVECQGMASSLVQRVGAEAGVPIYDGVASPQHPTAKLAEQLGGDTPVTDNRRFVLQAVLLNAIA